MGSTSGSSISPASSRSGAAVTRSRSPSRRRTWRHGPPRSPPRSIAVAGVALAMGGLAALVSYVRSDPMEYNMRRLQNDLGGSAEMYRVSALAANTLGANLESAMVVLVDRVDQVLPLKKTLE